MKNKKIVLLSVVVLAVVFVIASMFYTSSEDKKIEELATKNGAPFERAHSISFGKNEKLIWAAF